MGKLLVSYMTGSFILYANGNRENIKDFHHLQHYQKSVSFLRVFLSPFGRLTLMSENNVITAFTKVLRYCERSPIYQMLKPFHQLKLSLVPHHPHHI